MASLFHILETQVVPLYYANHDGRLPLAWIHLMRESIRSVTPAFNTHRMVKEYAERLYEPAAKAHVALGSSGGKHAVELSKWKDSIRKAWPEIHITDVKIGNTAGGQIAVGDTVDVSAVVHLGPITPEYVTVQAYFGETENNEIRMPAREALTQITRLDHGRYLYQGTIPARESGSYGLNVRVIPTHPNLTQEHELRLITWAR